MITKNVVKIAGKGWNSMDVLQGILGFAVFMGIGYLIWKGIGFDCGGSLLFDSLLKFTSA